MQPYSPELFRLGDLPGPRLLMEALRGKVTIQQLKKEWKAVEKEKQSGPSRQEIPRTERAQGISTRTHHGEGTYVRHSTCLYVVGEK